MCVCDYVWLELCICHINIWFNSPSVTCCACTSCSVSVCVSSVISHCTSLCFTCVPPPSVKINSCFLPSLSPRYTCTFQVCFLPAFSVCSLCLLASFGLTPCSRCLHRLCTEPACSSYFIRSRHRLILVNEKKRYFTWQHGRNCGVLLPAPSCLSGPFFKLPPVPSSTLLAMIGARKICEAEKLSRRKGVWCTELKIIWI